jgi:hypothetical protein
MSSVTRNLKQKATYWPTTPNGFGGYNYSSPQVLRCRWEDKAILFRNFAGEEVTSEAVIYLDGPVQEGGYLTRGESTALDPTTVGGRQIRRYFESPSLRNQEIERKAIL